MLFDFVDIDYPAIHGEATFFERPKYEVLAGAFLPAQGRKANELSSKGDLVPEAVIDPGEDVGSEFWVEHADFLFEPGLKVARNVHASLAFLRFSVAAANRPNRD
jgi:hypothetical protein